MQLVKKIWNVGIVTETTLGADPAVIEVARELEQGIKTLFGRTLACSSMKTALDAHVWGEQATG